MNPNGKVPVLKDGDKIVCESEEIINYVDKRCPSGKTYSSWLRRIFNWCYSVSVIPEDVTTDSFRCGSTSVETQRNESVVTPSVHY